MEVENIPMKTEIFHGQRTKRKVNCRRDNLFLKDKPRTKKLYMEVYHSNMGNRRKRPKNWEEYNQSSFPDKSPISSVNADYRLLAKYELTDLDSSRTLCPMQFLSILEDEN